MPELSIEYCAGFFDGEGSVMIRYDRRCNSYILKVSVSNTVAAPLLAMRERWGGCVVAVKPRKPHHSGWSEWLLQGGRAEPFLRAIRPYALCKAEQIDLAFELLATRTPRPRRGRRLSPEIQAQRLDIKNRLHAIKTKGHGLKGAS